MVHLHIDIVSGVESWQAGRYTCVRRRVETHVAVNGYALSSRLVSGVLAQGFAKAFAAALFLRWFYFARTGLGIAEECPTLSFEALSVDQSQALVACRITFLSTYEFVNVYGSMHVLA